MQSTAADSSWESRLPLSRLRSTASPCKKLQNPLLFSNYLSELALTNITNSKIIKEPSPLTMKPASLSLSNRQLPTPSTHVTDASKCSDTDSNSIQHLDIQSDVENASEMSPTPSSPLAVPSSPSSGAADISTALDFCQDEDSMTDIDLPECAIVPNSPFSSPLSTAPNSPTLIHVAIIPSERSASPIVTTIRSSRPSKSRRVSKTSTTSDDDDISSASGPSRKRARSLSPNEKSFRRPKVGRISGSKHERVSKGRPSQPSLGQLSPRSIKSSGELIGPLAQILALSGKSSLPTSSLMEDLFDASPALRNERTIEDWTALAVMTMEAYPIFGQAERQGLKNADNEIIEDEWYYRPENDEDEDRRETLGGFQRGGGKRRATLQKKQYYWKPVQ